MTLRGFYTKEALQTEQARLKKLMPTLTDEQQISLDSDEGAKGVVMSTWPADCQGQFKIIKIKGAEKWSIRMDSSRVETEVSHLKHIKPKEAEVEKWTEEQKKHFTPAMVGGKTQIKKIKKIYSPLEQLCQMIDKIVINTPEDMVVFRECLSRKFN